VSPCQSSKGICPYRYGDSVGEKNIKDRVSERLQEMKTSIGRSKVVMALRAKDHENNSEPSKAFLSSVSIFQYSDSFVCKARYRPTCPEKGSALPLRRLCFGKEHQEPCLSWKVLAVSGMKGTSTLDRRGEGTVKKGVGAVGIGRPISVGHASTSHEVVRVITTGCSRPVTRVVKVREGFCTTNCPTAGG
jgi:hypothetical protein